MKMLLHCNRDLTQELVVWGECRGGALQQGRTRVPQDAPLHVPRWQRRHVPQVRVHSALQVTLI